MEQVLLIEDCDEDYFAYQRALNAAAAAIRLHRLCTGDEALDYLDELQDSAESTMPIPGLIFLDLNLPGVSGLEVLTAIRARRVLCKTRVVVVTTSAAPRDRSQCEQLGVDGYIVKNMCFKQFQSDVVDLLTRWFPQQQLEGVSRCNGRT